MRDDPAPRVYGLPPGADLPQRLAARLIAEAGPPEALARVTVILNTARMRQRVGEALASEGARLLPRLLLVSDLADTPVPGLPAAVPPLRRRLELMQLIAGLAAADPVAMPPATQVALADSLARLIEEMQGEGVAPEAIAALEVDRFSAHWARMRDFMGVVAPLFATEAAPDAQGRLRRAVLHLAGAWALRPPDEPVIVAGSTGSRGATLALMLAVARLPRGAVLLPGFDATMPGPAWDALADPPAEDHPQFRFRRFLDALGLAPGQVLDWDRLGPPDPARNALLSLALRPAPVTDRWLAEGPLLGPMAEATARMTLVEAPTPQAEALAVAFALRRALARGRSAALVTPDRGLARRVTAALDRWGLVPDDSGGEPLALTPPGRFLRQVAGLMGAAAGSVAVTALLKHPLAAAGPGRGAHLRLAQAFEVWMREGGRAFASPDAVARFAEDRDPAWTAWLSSFLAGLAGMAWPSPLPLAVAALRRLAEALAGGPAGGPGALWAGPAGEAARMALDHLEAEAPAGGDLSAAAFAALLDQVLAGAQGLRATVEPYPGLAILGSFEVRAEAAEVVVLGGLNDGIWPPAPSPDPWLNRRMRMHAGLTLPDRQIGLSAHDFQIAAAAPEVVVTRALRDDSEGTVPSRWLNRLTNLLDGLESTGGPEALAAMRARGQALLHLVAGAERPADPVAPARRPSPVPPAAARPVRLTVTEMPVLARDPYAVYARRVLGLKPLPPFRAEADARLRGIVMHRVMEDFARGRMPGEARAAMAARLLALADRHLAQAVPWAAARSLFRGRLAQAVAQLLDAETEHGGTPMFVEREARLALGETGVVLVGRPDRIDRHADGRLQIFDYKTSSPPGAADRDRSDDQLSLLAAMALAGAFGDVTAGLRGAAYVSLSPSVKTPVIEVPTGEEALAAVWDGAVALVTHYRRGDTGFTALRDGAGAPASGDYAHLSRFGEWQTSDPAPREDVP